MITETNTARVEAIAPNQLHHARKAKALKLATMLDAEYPMIALHPKRDDADNVVGFLADHVDRAEEIATPIYEGDKVPELADLLEVAEEQGLSLEAEEDDEEQEASGSIVKEVYRKAYRESSSNGQTCGDWLAEWLTTETYSHSEGKANIEDLTAIFHNNGLDMTRPWARLPESEQPGWRGRYRMNGRQALEKAVALAGTVTNATGYTIDVPEADLAKLQAKHAKWLEKEQRKAEAAAKSIREAVEGEGA